MPSGISRLFDRSFQRNCAPLLDTEGLLSWSRASPAPQDDFHGLTLKLTVKVVSGSVYPCHARINYDNVGIGRKAFSDNLFVNLIFMVYLSEKILIHHKKRKAVVEPMNGKPFVQHDGKEQRKFQSPKPRFCQNIFHVCMVGFCRKFLAFIISRASDTFQVRKKAVKVYADTLNMKISVRVAVPHF